MNDENGFDEYKREILYRLEKLDDGQKELDTKLDKAIRYRDNKLEELRLEIVKLKMGAGMWGALAGLIPVITVLGIKAVFE